MSEENREALEDKMAIIKDRLKDILDDDDIELAFCLFRIKGSPGQIRTEKGHFYDITRELTSVVRECHQRMSGEIGL